MAKLNGKFLRGLIANLIFKKSGNEQIVTSMPDNVRQTTATKMASVIFGLASTLCSFIRDALVNELRMFKDGTMHHRLNALLIPILNNCRDMATDTFTFEADSFHSLTGLELNSHASLTRQLPGKLTVNVQDGLLNIAMPGGETARKLKFVKGSTACKMIFTVALFRLHEGLVGRYAADQSLLIEKKAPDLNGIAFSFEVPNDCLCLVTATLEYYSAGQPIHDRNLNCCTIIEAIYIQGTYDKSRNFLWNKGDLIFKRA